ncbi:MAG TPA: glucodextranase DOMON-like domain-containing protein [Solirubrobacteraceae bacterium]
MKRGVLAVTVVVGALCAAVTLTPALAAADVAPGAPGAQSYFDLARKDCVGTARNTTSRVWFTVADGVLSDTYWPNVDATNIHTLQYLVTDGSSFTDLQTRDMTYRVVPDPSGMSCTIVASSAAHHYRISTTYIADPARDAVLMRTRFRGPSSDQVYVRLDPLAGGTGGGGSANAGANSAELVGSVPVDFNTNTSTDATNRDYAVPTYEALQASHGFGAESVGYAGTASDGQEMLDSTHQLTTHDSAPDGHVALTAQLNLRRGRSTTLALGFGQNQTQALSVAGAAVAQRFGQTWRDYEAQWRRYDSQLRRPAGWLGRATAQEYYASVNVVKASEDKEFAGAIAAGLDSPWGQSVPAGNNGSNGRPHYFGSYREVFARDLYEAFTGLLVAGDIRTAQDATTFLFDRQQQADGSMPRNSLENGKPAPDTGGLQLDETSYPILMDWQSGLAHDGALYRDHVIPAADFLVGHGPSDGVERWEEQSGFSPSTISAEIAGLTAAAKIASVNHDTAHARLYQATADQFARKIKAWTVTTTGPYAPRYFIRVSKTGDPNAAISYNLGNGSIDADQRSIVDAGFLELVRLGILPARDPDIRASLSVIDNTIERQTDSGPGWYRYGTSTPGSEDGYGDCHVADPTDCSPEGAPWAPTGHGSGHLWPVLSDERAQYDIASGHGSSARTLLSAMLNMTSGQGLEPEQVWEDDPVPPSGTDPATASIGFTNGKPVGSASPLTWAQATVARLTRDLGAGRNLETPAIVSDRYVAHGMPGALPLTITSPAPGSIVTSRSITLTGTTAPHALVDAQAETPAGGAAATASATADGSGNWSLTLTPTTFGSPTITVTATKANSTGYAQEAVSDVSLPGTMVLNVADPSGDDNGPGTYAYPTPASVFAPGVFDITKLQVNEDASNVYIQTTLRNLVNTFGEDFGAQLLDIYVRDPSVSSSSTAAPFASRNYSIASGDAWTERIEAQGFAPVQWVNAANTSLGSAQLVADTTTHTATIILPRAQFGDLTSGWVFTLALTGQDGFSSDQARGFAPQPQDYTFGVCSAGESSPICAVSPGTVPKVMDTITPAGVDQGTELNPLNGPVQLKGIPVP